MKGSSFPSNKRVSVWVLQRAAALQCYKVSQLHVWMWGSVLKMRQNRISGRKHSPVLWSEQHNTALLSDDQWLITEQPCSPLTATMLICVAVVSVAVAPVGAGAGPQLGAAFWPSSGPCTSSLSTWQSSPGTPSTQKRCSIGITLAVPHHRTPLLRLKQMILFCAGVPAGDEHQETPEQDREAPRSVSQLPQSRQRQLGPA